MAIAHMRGVVPRTSRASTAAPASRSIFTTSGLEAAVAKCSAVSSPKATGPFLTMPSLSGDFASTSGFRARATGA